MSRFQGDPRLIITPDGSTLRFKGGQPIMDGGVEILKFFTTEKYKNLNYRRKINFLKTECKKFLEKQEKESIDNVKTKYKY